MPPDNTSPNPSITAIKQAAMGRRSPLYVWLLGHHAEFAKALTASGRHFRWADITAAISGEGLTDSRGKPPSKETVVLTWRRVCKVIEARQKETWGKRGRPDKPAKSRPKAEPLFKVEPMGKREFKVSTPKRDYLKPDDDNGGKTPRD